MNIRTIGLFAVVLLIIFIIVGVFIAFLMDKKENYKDLTISVFGASIISIIGFIFLPLIISYLKLRYIWVFIICTILGVIIAKVVDNFLPNHYTAKMLKKDLKTKNVYHMGLLSYIFLLVIDFIFGMIVYSKTGNRVEAGLLATVAYGFVLLLLNYSVMGLIYQSHEKTNKNCLILTLVLLIVTFLGGLTSFILKIFVLNKIFIGIMLSLFTGVLINIFFFELFKPAIQSKRRKEQLIGFVITLCIMIGAFLISKI